MSSLLREGSKEVGMPCAMMGYVVGTACSLSESHGSQGVPLRVEPHVQPWSVSQPIYLHCGGSLLCEPSPHSLCPHLSYQHQKRALCV